MTPNSADAANAPVCGPGPNYEPRSFPSVEYLPQRDRADRADRMADSFDPFDPSILPVPFSNEPKQVPCTYYVLSHEADTCNLVDFRGCRLTCFSTFSWTFELVAWLIA